jgi:cell division septation protein DedD
LEEPTAGKTYLQVMAVKRQDAEVIVRTLKDKGFPATLSPGPDDLVRVLVGPYENVASLGRARADLESAGVGNPIVRRY